MVRSAQQYFLSAQQYFLSAQQYFLSAQQYTEKILLCTEKYCCALRNFEAGAWATVTLSTEFMSLFYIGIAQVRGDSHWRTSKVRLKILIGIG
jgi:hypothetical protein